MRVKGDRFVKPWREENPILRISVGLEDCEDLWADLEAVCRALQVR